MSKVTQSKQCEQCAGTGEFPIIGSQCTGCFGIGYVNSEKPVEGKTKLLVSDIRKAREVLEVLDGFRNGKN